ncbi:MAG: protein kinase [Tannerella sp.]|jgi:serine/threonine protein kinase|nr:protein kinase [Tannerella sp.]
MRLEENAIFAERYKLMECKGKGGSSEVWLARDESVMMFVALKIYSEDARIEQDMIDFFRNEFKLVYGLNHENVLPPTSFDIYESMPYLVMKFCKNGSSLSLKNKMTEADAWKFLHDVASGLDYLWDHSIIHKDIKPDNVLIDDNGSFLISDFGISSSIRSTIKKSESELNNDFLTAPYASPERYQRVSLPAGDIWSMGASVYELLTGYFPFGGNGGQIQDKNTKIPKLDGQWSSKLKRMIRKCLAYKPSDRPNAAAIKIIAEKYMKKCPKPFNFSAFALRFIVIALVLAPCLLFFIRNKEPQNPPEPLPADTIKIQQDEQVENNDTVSRASTDTPINESVEKPAEKPVVKPQKSADEYLAEGNSFFNRGQYKEAIDCYKRYLELSGNNNPSIRQRIKTAETSIPIREKADLLYNEGKYAEAKAEYMKIFNSADTFLKERLRACDEQIKRQNE